MPILLTILALLFAINTSHMHAQLRWSTPTVIDSEANYEGRVPLVRDDSGELYTSYSSRRSLQIVVARSKDQGASWVKSEFLSSARASWAEDIAVDHLGNVWLLWISNFNEFGPYYINISKSTDGGITFSPFFSGGNLGDGKPYPKIAVSDDNSIFLFWYNARLMVTKFERGESAAQADVPLQTNHYNVHSNLDFKVAKDHTIHCVWEGYTDTSDRFRQFVFYSNSTDEGQTFSAPIRVDEDSTKQLHPTVCIDRKANVYVVYSTAYGIALARKLSDEETFTRTTVIQPDIVTYEVRMCIDTQDGIDLLWSTSYHGYFSSRSTDMGYSFTAPASYKMGLGGVVATPEGSILAIGYDMTNNFCLVKGSVLLSVSDPSVEPEKIFLVRNYPNPFNSGTTIQYSVYSRSVVSLRIYDISGKEAGVLVDGELNPGSYTVQWDASTFSSGVYVACLQINNKPVTFRRILLLR